MDLDSKKKLIKVKISQHLPCPFHSDLNFSVSRQAEIGNFEGSENTFFVKDLVLFPVIAHQVKFHGAEYFDVGRFQLIGPLDRRGGLNDPSVAKQLDRHLLVKGAVVGKHRDQGSEVRVKIDGVRLEISQPSRWGQTKTVVFVHKDVGQLAFMGTEEGALAILAHIQSGGRAHYAKTVCHLGDAVFESQERTKGRGVRLSCGLVGYSGNSRIYFKLKKIIKYVFQVYSFYSIDPYLKSKKSLVSI
jgi:hypothetical protein